MKLAIRSGLPILAVICTRLAAQDYVISTYAGGAPPPTPATGTNSSIGSPSSVATDPSGNVYFSSYNSVFKLDPGGVLTRVAGNSHLGYSGDGGPATRAQFDYFSTSNLAVDSAGELFIADRYRVRKVLPTGIVITVAGGGLNQGGGAGIPATSAQIQPSGIAVDSAGNLYIAETSNRVRKVLPSGIITTIAGNITPGFSGDGGPASDAQLRSPSSVAVDSAGNVYISDAGNFRVRKVSSTGIITTIAGTGTFGYSGDGGTATSAALYSPTSLVVDSTGNLYIADASRVRKVSSTGIITTIAGTGTAGYSGDGGTATSAAVYSPQGVALDNAGNLYIADSGNLRVRKVSASGIINTTAGTGTPYLGDGGLAAIAELNSPDGLALDSGGNLYIADANNFRIRKVSTAGVISTVAGNGTSGYSGDGGPATSAQLGYLGPSSVVVDSAGNLYISDPGNNRIRKVSSSGTISTVAGNGAGGYSGDGGLATNAALNTPTALALDGGGNLYIADSRNSRVRKLSSSGIITTIAGTGASGYSGDGGAALSAQINYPTGIAVDSGGNLYIVDSGNYRLRKVSPAGNITTIAGTGMAGGAYGGDGGLATSAQLFFPYGVAVDSTGNVYVSGAGLDFNVREISPAGLIRTIAGSSTYCCYSGDGGPALSAQINYPAGMAVDSGGNLYIADGNNNAVRLLRPANGSVLISAVVDAASEMSGPISPGKIVVIYGGNMGVPLLAQFVLSNGAIGTQVAGTSVSINGISAPILYASYAQVAAIVPYGVSGATALVTVSYQGQVSSAFSVPIAASAPSIFSQNQTGAGQAAAINVVDGTVNTAANPVKIGGYISLYVTGEGQTTPVGVDGKIATGSPLPAPNLKVSVTVGGVSAVVPYAGAAPSEVAGVMQVNVQIPSGIQTGGYVPVILQVGDASTTAGATWIAVAGN